MGKGKQMVAICNSAGIIGIAGYPVTVECFSSTGLPRLDIVGLPSRAVSESAERVRAVMKFCNFSWPACRLTINLAPADTKKEGAVYDLPILISILVATSQISAPSEDYAFLGELSLAGELRGIKGVLSMLLALRDAGKKQVFVPFDNAEEAAYAEGITVYPVKNIDEVIDHLLGRRKANVCQKPMQVEQFTKGMDFSNVLGQNAVRRALEIAAAGSHSALLSGPPGSGKSLVAKCFSTILPPMTSDERLEVIRIWSVDGAGTEAARMAGRPFRSPHHTVSAASMTGGGGAGRIPTPGEISLAHRGVLFLDELPEFRSDVLETLRQPIEDGQVTISRVSGKVTYPAKFQLLAAMNPCKCGWYGTSRCKCSQESVKKYLRKLSGPLMDRIDLQVAVQPVQYEALASRGKTQEESSEQIRKRVLVAREIQKERYKNTDITSNAELPLDRIAKDCLLTDNAQKMLEQAFERLGMTARAYDRILRVSRTVADLDGAEIIDVQHIAEAIQYRQLDRLGLSDG